MAVMYAKIHENTLLNQWEESATLGAIRLNPMTGQVIKSNLLEQAYENDIQIEWLKRNLNEVRLDQGYCLKSPRTHCQFLNQAVEQPCIIFKCSSFYVDSTFVDYYNKQISDIRLQMDDGNKAGRLRQVEILKAKLDKYLEIRNALNLINGGGDESEIKLDGKGESA
ncbi:hypothetical protein ACP8HI_09175 [Paenibacillus sp. FA6]|uniref:hypothetical protein n=1 Tax=Paenibacillus sp. FA6 TaxID=3413029 RepID=UPI003F654FDA